VFTGASGQRRKVHLARNILATVNHAHKDMDAATVRTIHAQPDAKATRSQLHAVVGMLEERFPKAAEIRATAEADVTADAAFPRAHWRKISSTNPLERINKEIMTETPEILAHGARLRGRSTSSLDFRNVHLVPSNRSEWPIVRADIMSCAITDGESTGS